eukprot:gb/GFBE01061660.1/.p1 GENE.gb/GFBE01061660.1/~~gb/GFBE01061660.1/.p1  ORF type:complete len:448 (+),score=58.64 gb/GFBE01061660.1/:1-1344(+)
MPSSGTRSDGNASAPSRVLVYSHSWLPGQVDGVAVRMMAHVNAMVKRGIHVTVATPDFVIAGEGSQTVPKFEPIPGVEHILLKSQKTPVYKKNICMQLSIGNFTSLVALIRRIKPDVVHGTQEASMQVLATACVLCDVPFLISMHTDVAQIAARDHGFSHLGGKIGRLHAWLSIRFVHWGYRNWAFAGGTYLPVSEQSKTILKNAGVRQTKVTPVVWGPMVDRDQFRVDLPEADVAAARQRLTFGLSNAYLMVYVGRVTAEKDIQFLVDALDRAPKNVVLALIGPGSMTAELSKLHGPEHRIYCTGKMVGREEVALSLRAADCHVSASTMETVGFTAMEAISCGTPMLAANAQGFAIYLSHGINARLFTPGDKDSFDRELATLMSTKPEGAWSRDAVRATMEMASIEACTNRAFDAYLHCGQANRRWLRIPVSTFLLALNWAVAFFQ